MINFFSGGTIGTGLFLGTGKSLATGGPASMLISYIIVGIIVFLTMLSLGEMAAFIPVAGSFCTFAGRFVDDAFGFALTWNCKFSISVRLGKLRKKRKKKQTRHVRQSDSNQGNSYDKPVELFSLFWKGNADYKLDWFNDAVSTAADLVALQLILDYWNTNFPGWALR
jgi:amino acid permease